MFVLSFHTSWTTGELPEDWQKAHEASLFTESKTSSLGNHRLVSLTLIKESSGLMGRVNKVTVFPSPPPPLLFPLVLPSATPGLEMTWLSKSPLLPCLMCIAASSHSDRLMWVRVEKGLKDGSIINSHQHGFVEKSCQMSLVLLFSEITSLADKGSYVYVVGFNICEAFNTVPHGILIKIISTIHNQCTSY